MSKGLVALAIAIGFVLGIVGTVSMIYRVFGPRSWLDEFTPLVYPGAFLVQAVAILTGHGSPHGGVQSFWLWMFLATPINMVLYSTVFMGAVALYTLIMKLLGAGNRKGV